MRNMKLLVFGENWSKNAENVTNNQLDIILYRSTIVLSRI